MNLCIYHIPKKIIYINSHVITIHHLFHQGLSWSAGILQFSVLLRFFSLDGLQHDRKGEYFNRGTMKKKIINFRDVFWFVKTT